MAWNGKALILRDVGCRCYHIGFEGLYIAEDEERESKKDVRYRCGACARQRF